MSFKYTQTEKIKNIKTLIVVLLILSLIPIILWASRDTKAEMNFPVEAVINVSSLNIRNDASTNGPIVGSISQGGEVLLLEEIQGQSIEGNTTWYRIDYKNQDGYVSARYVTIVNWTPEFPKTIPDDQEFEAYLETQGFPLSYRSALHDLHSKYPNWTFTALRVNSEFDAMVSNQYRPENSIAYVPASLPDALKSTASRDFNKDTNQWINYEPGWVAANRNAIAYYMDPRNFLDETHIFMFESLSYNPKIHDRTGVENLLKSSFMNSSYYVDAYMKAADISKVSPYHLISRSLTEVGYQGSDATTGQVPGLEGYYNFYSIGAFGSSTNPLINGLHYARDGELSRPARRELLLLPWDSPEKAIIGGSVFIGADYINNYQNTLYLQKWDLFHDQRYLHQYMTSIIAPMSESKKMYNAYSQQGSLSEAKEFLIPVFASIPNTPSPYPSSGGGTPNNWLRSIYIGNALLPGFNMAT